MFPLYDTIYIRQILFNLHLLLIISRFSTHVGGDVFRGEQGVELFRGAVGGGDAPEGAGDEMHRKEHHHQQPHDLWQMTGREGSRMGRVLPEQDQKQRPPRNQLDRVAPLSTARSVLAAGRDWLAK
jgi:hypothetical protein